MKIMDFGYQIGFKQPIQKKKEEEYQSKMFPGLDDEQSKRLIETVDKMGITNFSDKLQKQQEIYREILPAVKAKENQIKKTIIKNETFNELQNIKDPQEKATKNMALKMEDLADIIKTKYNLDSNAPTEGIIEEYNRMLNDMQIDPKLVEDYINGKSEELLYVSGLKDRPVEEKDTIDTLEDVGIGVGVGIGGLGALKLGGMAAESIGKGIYGLTLPPGTDEARAIQTAEAGLGPKPRTTVSSAIERPIAGTRSMIGTQAQKQANKIFTKTINPILEKGKTLLNIKSYIEELGKDIVKLAKGDPDKLNEYTEAIEEMKKSFSDKKFENLGLKDTHELKSGLQQRTPQKFFKGKEITNAYQELRGKLSSKLVNGLHNAISNEFGIDSAKLYKDYANLKGLAEVGVKSRSQAGIKGGFGGFRTTIAQELSTPITTTIGKTTYEAGKISQKIPDLLLKGAKAGIKGVKTIGKGLLAIDPINTPELLKYVPGTIGDAFEEYIKTNPASVALDKLFNTKSDDELRKEIKKEFPNIDDKILEQVIKGEKIILKI